MAGVTVPDVIDDSVDAHTPFAETEDLRDFAELAADRASPGRRYDEFTPEGYAAEFMLLLGVEAVVVLVGNFVDIGQGPLLGSEPVAVAAGFEPVLAVPYRDAG
ncbi:hypothetical protein ACIQ7D_04735 [Streptomyces sp. NPDC096310]|uniref:hypothetical protein n=1 Tax=Streptomyces sp. NPDC096310 TaxID=3366082 RepID=UPI00382D5E6C